MPGIRYCRRHQFWESRWMDAAGRPVWHRLSTEPGGCRSALDAAADVYGCDPDTIINHTPDREDQAYGICADGGK